MSSKLILWADVICVGYYYLIFFKEMGLGGLCLVFVCVVGFFLFKKIKLMGQCLLHSLYF